MRIDYEFKCSRCGSNRLIQYSTNISCRELITVTDYGAGPEIEVIDEDYYCDNADYVFLCGDCNLELPMYNDDELIAYLVLQRIAKKQKEGDNE